MPAIPRTDEGDMHEWQTAGFEADEAERWQEAEFEPKQAETWQTAGFESYEAEMWRNARFRPWEAAEWRAAGFEPWEAARWQRVWPDPVVCAKWRDGQFSPPEMRKWTAALDGLVYPEGQFDAARHWTSYGFKPSEAVRWLQAGFERDEAGLAAAWGDRGFSLEDAARLRSEGLGPDDTAARRPGAV